MLANRMAFVVFFHGKHVLNKLESLPVDVTYVSKKQHYAIVYGDLEQENNIKKQLKGVKGFKYFGQSQTYDETLNF
jgi:uncharacterized protein YlbG (UPF0298 family)